MQSVLSAAESPTPSGAVTEREAPTVPWDPLRALPWGHRWLWLALAILVCCMQGPNFVRCLRPDRSTGVDYFQEWASAKNLLNGLPLYDRLDLDIERYLGYRLPPGERFTFSLTTHPPVSILLAVPLTVLDYPDAVLVWNLLSLAALGASLWIVGRQLGMAFSWWSLVPLITLLLLCGPLLHQVAQGQLNLVLLLLITGAWAAERSGRPGWAGVLLGLAAAIKVFPVFLFLYLVLRRQWRAVFVGAAVLLALALLTVAVMGPDTCRRYVSVVLPSLNEFRAYWSNVSISGFFSKLFDPPAVALPHAVATPDSTAAKLVVDGMPVFRTEPLWQSHTLAVVGIALSSAAVLGALAWAVWRSRSRSQVDLAFGLSVTAMLLVSSISWDHYLLLLLVPWVLVWVRVPSSTLVRWLFLAMSVVLWVMPSEFWRLLIPLTTVDGRTVWDVATPRDTLTVLSLQFYSLLVLFAFLLVLWRKAANRFVGRTFLSALGAGGQECPPYRPLTCELEDTGR